MSHDLRDALGQIASAAGDAMAPVPADRVRTRLRRRRAARAAAGSTGVVAGVGGVATAIVLAATGLPPAPTDLAATSPAPVTTATATASATPTPTPQPTTPVAGWTVGPAPCGQPLDLAEVDSPDLEIQGGIVVGTLDPQTALFTRDPAGDVVLVDVITTTQVPGLPGGDGLSRVQTYLLDADGTVAFWDDPARERPQIEAADGSGVASTYGTYDALDCRTGRPLQGTYRVVSQEVGEVLELAPVTFGEADPTSTGSSRSADAQLPVCGEPATPELLTAPATAPLQVTLEAGASLDAVSAAGVHLGLTVTATGTQGRLAGRVPQALSAVLVDPAGRVVTTPVSMFGPVYPSGATFDVDAGETFPAEVFQWFEPCAEGGMAAVVPPGDYDLYVYDVLAARTPDGGATSAVAAGGPFPITVIDDGWGS